MRQLWPKIDQENSDGECLQYMIIPHMLALTYIQCLVAKNVSRHIGLLNQIIFICRQLEHD